MNPFVQTIHTTAHKSLSYFPSTLKWKANAIHYIRDCIHKTKIKPLGSYAFVLWCFNELFGSFGYLDFQKKFKFCFEY